MKYQYNIVEVDKNDRIIDEAGITIPVKDLPLWINMDEVRKLYLEEGKYKHTNVWIDGNVVSINSISIILDSKVGEHILQLNAQRKYLDK